MSLAFQTGLIECCFSPHQSDQNHTNQKVSEGLSPRFFRLKTSTCDAETKKPRQMAGLKQEHNQWSI